MGGLLISLMLEGVALDGSRYWDESLRQQLPESDIMPLTVEGEPFLALYHHAETGNLSGGVVIVPDFHAHPDWPGVVQTLRNQLPRFGWSTLSIQLAQRAVATVTEGERSLTQPLPMAQLLQSTPARIDAAIAAMEQIGVSTVVLLGHGVGAQLVVHYMRDRAQSKIRGMVLVSLDGTAAPEGESDTMLLLRTIGRPILDIFGELGPEAVVASARRRKNIAVTAPPGERRIHRSAEEYARLYHPSVATKISYRQVVLPATGHQFHGSESLLLKRVLGWLRRYIAE
ncbi:DUF3530 family protein [Ectothiorhodospiraceae bacterium BW-2]|nr:DUF3530 family protein [Ectothiorhodospiraceae bacterium BW-2]